jgi:hypothetical protein
MVKKILTLKTSLESPREQPCQERGGMTIPTQDTIKQNFRHLYIYLSTINNKRSLPLGGMKEEKVKERRTEKKGAWKL